MTVEVYLCEKFQHGHERRAFGRFLQEMLDRYQDSPDLYLILVEPEANTASIDLLIITPRAFIMVELKELVHVVSPQTDGLALLATENAPWKYTNPDGSIHHLGAAGGQGHNPYQQAREHYFLLRDWLLAHPQNLPGSNWTANTINGRLNVRVVISPGFDPALSTLDLPWSQIRRWFEFKVLTIDQLAYDLETTVTPGLAFTPQQMAGLAAQLGGVRRENLQEFVPNYRPPAPRVSFFARPPVARLLLDRRDERRALLESLQDDNLSMICLGGPGGIGKTYLAGWLAKEAESLGYTVLWVSCNEREVTAESFLAAVAHRMPDDYLAAFIHEPKQKLSEKFEVALEFLDRSPCLIVIDDYHKAPAQGGLDDLFARIIHTTTRVKVALTTRVRPACLDDPGCAPGSVAEISLGGLPVDVIKDFVRSDDLSDEQLEQIWQRTAGNPYALGLFASMLRTRRDQDSLARLPLFNDDRAAQWAASLVETVTGAARTLANRLAVVRTTIPLELAEKLAASPEKSHTLLAGLIDHYVLHLVGPGTYLMRDYIREALLARAPQQDLLKAHQVSGSYFENIARTSTDPQVFIEAMLQASDHLEQAGAWRDLLRDAADLHQALLRQGDDSRGRAVAAAAVRAAKALPDSWLTAFWLMQQVRQEIDLKPGVEAQRHLAEAFNTLPKGGRKETPEDRARRLSLEGRLWIQKGRLAYFKPENGAHRQPFEKGLDLIGQSGDQAALAEALVDVAQIERYLGEYAASQAHFTQASLLAEQLGESRLLLKCISHIGLIQRRAGDFASARDCFTRAIELAARDGYLIAIEINQGLLGDVALRQGDFPTAAAIFTERLAKARQYGNQTSVRITLGWLAEAQIGLGQLAEAAANLDKCERLNQALDDPIGIAWTLRRRGQLEHARGHYAEGNRLIEAGMDVLRQANNVDYLPDFAAVLVKEPFPGQLKLWE
jgi:tetratricopeptide (TPR) repeat protein